MPPDPLPPGQPGDLIRTEPSRLVLEPSGQLGAIMATGTRIMYRSTDTRGNPIAVTGTYFEPYNEWPGKGPRPLISYAPGTQGPRQSVRPVANVQPGHPLFGRLGHHVQLRGAVRRHHGRPWVRHRDDRLRGPGHPLDAHLRGPGGRRPGRARCRPRGHASAGNLAGSAWARGVLGILARRRCNRVGGRAGLGLCPRPHIVGTYAGAPPANLKELLPYADGSVLVGVVGYALNSVMAAYPEAADAIRSKMTPRGLAMLESVSRQCVGQTLLDFMFRHLQPYFTEDIYQLVNEEPFSSLFERSGSDATNPTHRC